MSPERIPVNSVIPAAVTPFNDKMEVDHNEFFRHIEALSAIDGVTAIMVNGAVGHDSQLTRDEKTRLLKDAVGAGESKTPILAAVRESEIESDIGLLAGDAEEAGADAILIMPPRDQHAASIEGALGRFGKVLDNSSLPVAFYQVNPKRYGYPVETLVELVKQDRVFAVKEGCGDPETCETEMRAMRAVDPGVAIWSTHSRWLLADLAMGADGLLSGMGSVNADLHVALCRAMWKSDLTAARKINDLLYRLTQVFYGPGQNPHTRMKYALKKLGRIKNDNVRPPLQQLDKGEQERIDHILVDIRGGS